MTSEAGSSSLSILSERPPRSSVGAGVAVHPAAVGLGANLGDREATLLAAWRELGERPGVRALALSSPYVSAPLDMHSEHAFLNAVGLVETTLAPLPLLRLLLDIEARHGRRRDPKVRGYQDRPLDLDLLLFGDLRLHSPELILPHPRLHERLFALEPLAEILPAIVPDWRHPTLGLGVRELRDRLRRRGEQRLRRTRWSAAGVDGLSASNLA